MHLRIFALHCVVYVFLARERGEEGEWDEWEGGGRTKKRGPTFPLLPYSSHSPSSPPTTYPVRLRPLKIAG
jgi:hypothetical protein